MGPLDHTASEGTLAHDLVAKIDAGWSEARERLPRQIARSLVRAPAIIMSRWQHLPCTLIHGDAKVANFARAQDGSLCLLDWAFVGWAPCTFELGWFLAVNASRLAESKAQVIGKYRALLAAYRQRDIDDTLWSSLVEAGLVCGALMLLWSKALALAVGRLGAEQEWDWWVAKLEPWAEDVGDGNAS